MQTTCLSTWALKGSSELCCSSSNSEMPSAAHPLSLAAACGGVSASPSPGAQGDVFAEGEADNRGKWAGLCTPMEVAHSPGHCCPRQAEASGLSQPRPHVAGTLLFVLVPGEGSSASLGTHNQNCRHLTVQSRAWGHQGLVRGTAGSPRSDMGFGGAWDEHQHCLRALQAENPGKGNPWQAWVLLSDRNPS